MAGDVLSVIQSGLESVDAAMQAVSDDLANSGTTGFQSEAADFATLLGEFVNGSPLGGGAVAQGIVRDFSQGAITQSNSPTDLAIQGNGFFVFQDPSGNQVFSRDGHMTVSASGQLQAFNGDQVLGFPISSSGSVGGLLGPITIPQGLLGPTASTKNTLSGNLDASSPVITGAINPSDPTTYNSSVSTQVFDSLGNAHIVTFFFQNAGVGAPPAAENWNWTATLDGSTAGLANNSGTLGFDANGNEVSGGIPAAALTATPAGAAPLALNLNLSAITEFASANAVSGSADGNAAGGPSGVSINNKGVVSVAYSNGTTVNVAQVAVATFVNNQGLALSNGGVYQQTSTSGAATIATAGAGAAGSIDPSSLESSNVNTTGQLVSLVVLQRSFQANSQALQTQDNILSTLIHIQSS
ncbi:MAG TPA: flagellar hook-basal body complex protein [Candidatus Binataceae bacterium]|nr:flagellar hook-basal body complex protein [Candidatus Binataceae bacterium]